MCEIITAVFNRFPLVPKDKPEAVKTSKSSTASSTTKDSEVSSIIKYM